MAKQVKVLLLVFMLGAGPIAHILLLITQFMTSGVGFIFFCYVGLLLLNIGALAAIRKLSIIANRS